jgi:hypothetical protein
MPKFELRNIVTKGRKQVPLGTQVMLSQGQFPGTLTLRVKLPGQAAWTTYADLQIRDGKMSYRSA